MDNAPEIIKGITQGQMWAFLLILGVQTAFYMHLSWRVGQTATKEDLNRLRQDIEEETAKIYVRKDVADDRFLRRRDRDAPAGA